MADEGHPPDRVGRTWPDLIHSPPGYLKTKPGAIGCLWLSSLLVLFVVLLVLWWIYFLAGAPGERVDFPSAWGILGGGITKGEEGGDSEENETKKWLSELLGEPFYEAMGEPRIFGVTIETPEGDLDVTAGSNLEDRERLKDELTHMLMEKGVEISQGSWHYSYGTCRPQGVSGTGGAGNCVTIRLREPSGNASVIRIF